METFPEIRESSTWKKQVRHLAPTQYVERVAIPNPVPKDCLRYL